MESLIKVTDKNPITDIKSTDIKEVSEILATMNARFREFEKRGETHLRGWIVNEDNVGVGWIIFENLGYSSLRFHRSIFEFNCAELQLRLDNWQLKRNVEFERKKRLELHYELSKLTNAIKNNREGRGSNLLREIKPAVSANISYNLTAICPRNRS